MCTLLGLKSTTLSLLHTIAAHDKQNSHQIKNDKPMDDKQEPLMINTKQNNFEHYWKFICMELREKRLYFLFNNMFTSLNIPLEIWNLILEYELIHPIHDIIYQYLTSIQHSLNSIYFIPFLFGTIQFVIIGFILSGFYEVIFTHLAPTHFNFYLTVAGIILSTTSFIQIICCIYSIFINYNTSNIIQLSKLKQVFYQKKQPILKRSVCNIQQHNDDDSLTISISDCDEKKEESIIDIISVEDDNERFASLLLKYTKIKTIECKIEYANNGDIEWRVSPSINGMSLTALQPWELLIPVQKWCNVLYVQNILFYQQEYILNKLQGDKSAFFQPNIWFVMLKPLFIFVLGFQLITLSSYLILIWIPYCTLLCFLVWRCVFNVSFYASICWSIIVCCLEFWEVSSETKWWDSSLTSAINGTVDSFQEIFILIGAYSLVFLCQKSNKILLCGVWPSWVLAYVLLRVEQVVNTDKNKYIKATFSLLSIYCIYISTQFMVFCIPKYNNLKLFSNLKFIISTWLFAWLDVQSMNHLYHNPKLDLLPC
eukprot:349071_1